MLMRLIWFELKYHLGQLTYVLAAVLFFGLGAFTAAQGGFGGAEVHKNSPYVITNILALFSLLGIFAGTLFSANVVLRDTIYKMDAVIFSTSVKRAVYFAVRYLGLLAAVFSLMVFTVLGIGIACFFVDNDKLGAFNINYFLQPLLVFGFPNVLFSTALIFCTTVLTKNVRAIYVTGVLLYILYMVASILGNSPLLATSTLKVNDGGILPFLIDPFGLASFFSETRNWVDAQRNQELFPVKGAFLINRLLWLSVSALVIGISYRFFNFSLQSQKQSATKGKTEPQIASVIFNHFNVYPNGFGYNFKAFCSQFKIEVISLFKHIPFMVMLLLWVFLFGVELKDAILHGPYGIKYYPTTGAIIEEMRSLKFGLVLLIFYAAELTGREHTANIQALIYSTPVRNAVLWGAKCLTLCLLVVTLVTLNIGIGIGLQLSNGFFDLDLPRYFSLYYYSAAPLLPFVVLIVFVQSLTANKYLGMLLSMVVVFVLLFAQRFGIEHPLLRFANMPDLQFSYFNSFGHYAKAFNWYMLYWAGFATILGVITVGIWQGSAQDSFLHRLRSIPKFIYKTKLVLIIAVVVWLGSGIYIYRQTNLLNVYRTAKEQVDWRVNYEKKYKALAGLPQPIIKSVKTQVDLFTNEGKYDVKGSYTIRNESAQPISRLWVSLHPSVTSFGIEIPNAKKHETDKEYNQQFIDLETPLQPGAELAMDFSFEVVRSSFAAFDPENALVSNGSYIEMEKFVPQFGYNEGLETGDKQIRKEAGLPPVVITPSTDLDYHLIDLETTISTAADQQVVTVGALKKTWMAGNRSYFTYKTEQPINFMFALSSARYQVKTEDYKGIRLKAYYQQGHEYNLSTMFKAIKDALDYGTANYWAYPLKHFTLAEIPQYRGAATAYPGLLFNAERINFLTDYTNTRIVNQSYAITAHEVAHQWWANKLSPVSGSGAAMLTESLAKYTEAMLVEKTYGRMYLRNYLRDDNNLYFANNDPNEKELPLAQTYDQNNVHYQKGSLTMYSMKEVLGEKVFNNALKQLIEQHASPNKKAKAADLVSILNQVAPANQKRFIDDSFNQVVTYELAIKVLSSKPTADGKFRTDLRVTTGLNRLGEDRLQSPDMDLDIALFDRLTDEWDKNTAPIYLKKYRVNRQETTFSIITDKKPKAAAVNPYNYLPDADLSDNTEDIK
jgi:ABC-2 type transport system permease protein